MQASKIKDVIAYLESLAPGHYQESYDNSGLLTGNPNWEIKGVLVTLDCTEAVVAEAIATRCNLIIAHHPVIFKGLKKLTGQNYVERTVIAAIKNDIAIYAAHTNLDNIAEGVNKKIAEKIGLRNLHILSPRKSTLSKIETYIPGEHLQNVLNAMHAAGGGHIGNYSNCSFQIDGIGTFQPNAEATPLIGTSGKKETVKEVKVEMIFPSHQKKAIVAALRSSHPYEEVAYYLIDIENDNQEVGLGIIGDLSAPEEPIDFLRRLKLTMNASVIRHTTPVGNAISKVAVCGGAGSFLLTDAIAQRADVYVSADFKYHEFFDADGKIMIADVGHFESEQFTKDLFKEVLSKKFPTFAINFSKTVTNPISYL